MPFVTIRAVTGKVYVPEKIPGICRKHPCPDCFSCQYCSDDRCNVCRGCAAQSGSSRRQSSIRAAATAACRLSAEKNKLPGGK